MKIYLSSLYVVGYTVCPVLHGCKQCSTVKLFHCRPPNVRLSHVHSAADVYKTRDCSEQSTICKFLLFSGDYVINRSVNYFSFDQASDLRTLWLLCSVHLMLC